MFLEPKTLIVVYKDELMLNQLKKLIETRNAHNADNIICIVGAFLFFYHSENSATAVYTVRRAQRNRFICFVVRD